MRAVRGRAGARFQPGADRLQGLRILRDRLAPGSVESRCACGAGNTPAVFFAERLGGVDVVRAGSIFLLTCIVVAVVFVLVGAGTAAAAGLRTKRRADEVQRAATTLDVGDTLRGYETRLRASADAMQALLPRTRTALETLNAALRELRMPQAMLAIRTAAVAVRALTSGR